MHPYIHVCVCVCVYVCVRGDTLNIFSSSFNPSFSNAGIFNFLHNVVMNLTPSSAVLSWLFVSNLPSSSNRARYILLNQSVNTHVHISDE